MPHLSAEAQRVVPREEIRLGEIQFDTAIEARVSRHHASRPRATEEVHVAPVDFRARPFFAAVPEREIHSPVPALRDRDAGGDRFGLFVADLQRLDVGEIEEFQ